MKPKTYYTVEWFEEEYRGGTWHIDMEYSSLKEARKQFNGMEPHYGDCRIVKRTRELVMERKVKI